MQIKMAAALKKNFFRLMQISRGMEWMPMPMPAQVAAAGWMAGTHQRSKVGMAAHISARAWHRHRHPSNRANAANLPSVCAN